MQTNKVLINTANLRKGGALQTAISFVNQTVNFPSMTFLVILGEATGKLILQEDYINQRNISFKTVEKHPATSISNYFKYIKKMDQFVIDYNINTVVTVFGPAYWAPKVNHITGFANGYYLYEDSPFFKTWQGRKSISYIIKKYYHRYLLRKGKPKYWVETLDSKLRLANFLDVPDEKIIVATNNANEFFYNRANNKFEFPLRKAKYRLIFVSSYYEHKNHKILPKVVDCLSEMGLDVEIFITIDNQYYKDDLVHEKVINLGSIIPKMCPSLYESADAVIMPSLLETFSATYPEAMIMKKPIITSDLSFARELCGNAAIYYQHDSYLKAAEAVKMVLTNENLYKELIFNGLNKLQDFDKPNIRFSKVLMEAVRV